MLKNVKKLMIFHNFVQLCCKFTSQKDFKNDVFLYLNNIIKKLNNNLKNITKYIKIYEKSYLQAISNFFINFRM